MLLFGNTGLDKGFFGAISPFTLATPARSPVASVEALSTTIQIKKKREFVIIVSGRGCSVDLDSCHPGIPRSYSRWDLPGSTARSCVSSLCLRSPSSSCKSLPPFDSPLCSTPKMTTQRWATTSDAGQASTTQRRSPEIV